MGLEAATANSGRVALAVLDHVTSMPSMVLPIKRLVALCHSFGVPVFVDGAHAVGNVEVDVQNIGAGTPGSQRILTFLMGPMARGIGESRGFYSASSDWSCVLVV